MPSKVDICNRALVELGADTIIALTEDSTNARRCNLIYDECRQNLLRDYPWNFAVKQASLARSASDPLFDFQYAYALPAKCIKVLRVDGSPRFSVKGRFIHCDEESVLLEYIEDVDDPAQYDALFREALSMFIAYKLGYAITASTTLAQEKYQLYLNALTRARGADSLEGSAPFVQPTKWTRAHIGNGTSYQDFTIPEE